MRQWLRPLEAMAEKTQSNHFYGIVCGIIQSCSSGAIEGPQLARQIKHYTQLM